MQASNSHKQHSTLLKSLNLGSHNTELIKKLVVTKEAAENAKRHSEHTNAELQKQMKERELAEECIRVSEKRMSAIFDGMQDIIYQTDQDGKIIWTAISIKQLFGYSVDEVSGINIVDLYACSGDYDDLKHGLMEISETRSVCAASICPDNHCPIIVSWSF